ncbi:MAG: hypothetical protein PUP91_29780 [Rhizonema sp. PD37]|nr:hypothetical protein [Rhizonema sp. PD37]
MPGLARRESLLDILGDRTMSEKQIQEMMDRKNDYYKSLMQQIKPVYLLPKLANLIQ